MPFARHIQNATSAHIDIPFMSFVKQVETKRGDRVIALDVRGEGEDEEHSNSSSKSGGGGGGGGGASGSSRGGHVQAQQEKLDGNLLLRHGMMRARECVDALCVV